MSILKWIELTPKEWQGLHWYAAEDGWTFNIYHFEGEGIPYHLKVTVGEQDISISWFSDLDLAKRCAEKKTELINRVILEIFK